MLISFSIPILLLLTAFEGSASPLNQSGFSLAALLNGTDTDLPSHKQIDSAKTFVSSLISAGKEIALDEKQNMTNNVRPAPIQDDGVRISFPAIDASRPR